MSQPRRTTSAGRKRKSPRPSGAQASTYGEAGPLVVGGLLLLGRCAAREHVAEELPLAALMPPDNDVFPVVDYVARLVAQLVLADLSGRRAMTENIDCFQRDAGNPGIKSALPEFLDRI